MDVFGENAGIQLQSRFQWLQPQVSTFFSKIRKANREVMKNLERNMKTINKR